MGVHGAGSGKLPDWGAEAPAAPSATRASARFPLMGATGEMASAQFARALFRVSVHSSGLKP